MNSFLNVILLHDTIILICDLFFQNMIQLINLFLHYVFTYVVYVL